MVDVNLLHFYERELPQMEEQVDHFVGITQLFVDELVLVKVISLSVFRSYKKHILQYAMYSTV